MIWARWYPPEASNYAGGIRPCNGLAGLGEINDEELDRLDFGIRDFSCDGVWSSSFDTYIFGVTKDVPPTEEDGYIAPKKGPTWDGKNHGWKDKNGNIWVPVPDGSRDAHGGGHWDVQDKLGRGYVNRYPGGKERAGGGKRPSIPKIQISGSNVSSESIETGVRIAGILFGTWVVVKWGAAIALTPETGGTSLVLAGVTP